MKDNIDRERERAGWRGREREVHVEKSDGVIEICMCLYDTTFDLCVCVCRGVVEKGDVTVNEKPR